MKSANNFLRHMCVSLYKYIVACKVQTRRHRNFQSKKGKFFVFRGGLLGQQSKQLNFSSMSWQPAPSYRRLRLISMEINKHLKREPWADDEKINEKRNSTEWEIKMRVCHPTRKFSNRSLTSQAPHSGPVLGRNFIFMFPFFSISP